MEGKKLKSFINERHVLTVRENEDLENKHVLLVGEEGK